MAVSGGPDSLALLLLAHAALPQRVEAATVDHGLRDESAAEAAMVAGLCHRLGIEHATLPVALDDGNVQDRARAARYAALGAWMERRSLDALATAHHADDQAETLLMRLNRGSGLSGLAGIRECAPLPCGRPVVRPLLAWRRSELSAVVEAAGITPVDDPSNRDPAYDRARIRQAMAAADWLDPVAIATSARLLAEAEVTIAAIADDAFARGVSLEAGGFRYRPEGPRLVRYRVVQRILQALSARPRGGQVAALVERLEGGGAANLAGVMARAEGEAWLFAREAPRRTG
ncbi:MAG: tRNA lysidine(34) synthetase TilS [Pseudomonadota bacterium]|nr:tRNA lysidine(34) synthetase TilS [Pseudomonadota bacterium]